MSFGLLMLSHIIPSKTRRKILELLFHHPDEHYYLRKIVREIDEEVNAVKRELDILEECKVLTRERRLNKVFYSLNKNFLHYDEFLRIFSKALPLCVQLHKNHAKIGKIKYIVMSVKYPKRLTLKNDEIYFLLVGTVVVPEVTAMIKNAEASFIQEINYTVMTEDEFMFRKRNNDPFIWRFLKQPKIMLAGNEEDLMK